MEQNSTIIECRSVLFTCGLDCARFDKGELSGADGIILDLEDSVPAGRKDEARKNIIDFFQAKSNLNATYGIRINNLRHPEGLKDILALYEQKVVPDVLVVSKVESSEELLILDEITSLWSSKIRFVPLIESAGGLLAVDKIATATKRVAALMFGSADYAASVGSALLWDQLHFARTMIVVASARAAIGTIDTPYFNLNDLDGLKQESLLSKKMGFSGKVCVHVSQVSCVNEVFSPSMIEIELAKEIISNLESNSNRIRVLNDGSMVGPPFEKRARKVLEAASKYSVAK